MKSVILYDSQGGNTAKVAEAIQRSLTAKAMTPHMVKVEKELIQADLLAIENRVKGVVDALSAWTA